MNSLKGLCRIRQLTVRNVRQFADEQDVIQKKLKRLQELQKLYQKDDGLPVYLKRGARDKALYYFTVALTGVGLAMVGEFVYSLP